MTMMSSMAGGEQRTGNAFTIAVKCSDLCNFFFFFTYFLVKVHT